MAANKPPKPRTRSVPEGSAPEPVDDSLDALRDAASGCKRCDLWKPATQTVFGPAGKLFDRALDELGIDRTAMYVTNAVKHFRFERRGKVRLHRSPDPGQQKACRVWLEGELERIRPDVVVCLGAIAAKAILGSRFGLMKQRGEWQELPNGMRVLATVHPSYVLRQRDSGSRRAAFEAFVRDLAPLSDM